MVDLLTVRGVRKSFGGLCVLDGVDLTVPEGGITGLIGANGSGKSTLFDVVTGYQPCESGAVTFAGQALAGLAPYEVARRGLIRTFQLTRIFPTLTVAENVLVFDESEDRAREMLDFVGLTRLAGQEAATLSYGQQKLLEIAQVLMLRPRMLMLDEPMAGINPALAGEICDRLRELRAGGMTLLLVEHNIPVLQGLCDTVAVLGGGRVLTVGPCERVLADHRVREAFLGE